MCKVFSATLKRPTRSWFKKLSSRTIDLFADLGMHFVTNFISHRVTQKNVSHLFTIHQRDRESLKDYFKRFNQAVLKVEDPSDKVVIMTMMEGLRPGPLFHFLSKSVPETLSILQSKIDKYIVADELVEAKQGVDLDLPKPLHMEDLDSKDVQPHPEKGTEANGKAEEEVYNFSTLMSKALQPITFTNEDLKGLHLSHDDTNGRLGGSSREMRDSPSSPLTRVASPAGFSLALSLSLDIIFLKSRGETSKEGLRAKDVLDLVELSSL
ncbi:hypothetical protein Acr_01g0013650 [Actinidia rufa]|uniref:Retrotransposon gag domain-containing protein n=1 Tax=Actinidia rufa TaxID=165716 RepID=A0A7J0E5W5_9ERIC|nr:hypothetical protein Acr_01g0013650 [Actinidia rufa]